jgi:hypothetical protein
LTGTAEANSTVKVYDGATLLGSATANGSGAWSFTTGALSNAIHSLTATATDAAGSTGAASTALSMTVDAVAPVAPTIASFSPDSGTVGDHITSDSTPMLTGTAAANSTVKVYDGATLLGSATANGTGAWSYTTAALTNGAHSLTATATDAAGNTGVASAALSVTIDTTTINAPTINSFSPDSAMVGDGLTDAKALTLIGAAVASSTVNVYDGTTLLGTAIANGSGAWSITAATLTDGTHHFTATDMVSGVTSAKSAALAVTVDTAAPAAPVITNDTVVNTYDAAVTGTALDQGHAEAGDIVKVYDGSTLIGMTTTSATAAWSYTTTPLADGYHVLTATVTDVAGNTSVPSQAFDPAIPPAAPVITTVSPDTGVVGDSITDANVLMLSGMAAANSAVRIYDGSTLLGATTVNGSGAWGFTTAKLSDGTHNFTATDTDAYSLTSAASSAFKVTVDTVAPTDVFVSDVKNSNGSFTLTGTALDRGVAEAGDVIKVYDGTTYLGSTADDSNGQWSFTTAALKNTVHTFTSTASDVAGYVGPSSGVAIYGSTGKNTLASTAGDDIMTGNGGADTFVFNKSTFGKDVITDFATQGGHHDVIQFSSTVLDSVAAVLAHAAQVGPNVVITADATHAVTLQNETLFALHSYDFHFV